MLVGHGSNALVLAPVIHPRNTRHTGNSARSRWPVRAPNSLASAKGIGRKLIQRITKRHNEVPIMIKGSVLSAAAAVLGASAVAAAPAASALPPGCQSAP